MALAEVKEAGRPWLLLGSHPRRRAGVLFKFHAFHAVINQSSPGRRWFEMMPPGQCP